MSGKSKDNKLVSDAPNLILCEGADAHRFLIWFLDFCKKNDSRFNTFRVYDFGGNNDLKRYLRLMTQWDDFKSIVTSLCVIRDAETDASAACQSIHDAFTGAGLAAPATPCSPASDAGAKHSGIRTGFLLFPSCCATLQNGTLEDLCLRILAKEDAEGVLSDADKALEPYEESLPRLHKNRLHAYFSLTDAFVGDKIGEAAQKQAFRYDGPEIASLKSFLLNMAGVA